MESSRFPRRIVGRRDDGEKSAGEANHSLRHRRIHVGERNREGLDLIGHGVRIPVGIGENKAMLPVIARTSLDIELHQLRRAQLPGIGGRSAHADGRIMVGGIHLNERHVAQLRPGLPGRALANRRRTQTFRVLNDALLVQLE
jgi:hypothetical protein